MKKKVPGWLPYFAVLVVNFYLLPLLIRGTGAGMLLLLGIIPLITFICSVVYGIRRGFDFLLPLGVMLLFAFTIFIYYNESAWGYIIIYGIISLIGNAIGRIFYNKNRR